MWDIRFKSLQGSLSSAEAIIMENHTSGGLKIEANKFSQHQQNIGKMRIWWVWGELVAFANHISLMTFISEIRAGTI